uniref:Uncharacterized protein n=1 Tax=Anguilla anguilla TaxID=7936 RepID=A0A0E9U4D0_ANGAN
MECGARSRKETFLRDPSPCHFETARALR